MRPGQFERLPGAQHISANEFKRNIAATYAAADRGPVAIVKARGTGGGVVSHVLLSVADYHRLIEGNR